MAAQEAASATTSERQSLQDAWWTGPLLADSAATLPRGHFLIEPYIYDVIGSHTHALGSRVYVLYGLADRFSVGAVPIVGYNEVRHGPSSSRLQFADIAVLGQYQFTQFHEHGWVPQTALRVQETFPTGAYDHLGTRLSDGLGGGAYTTTISLNTQSYFWLPTGRILRLRFNVSQSFSSGVDVEDASVYGTATGFRGRATPGASFFVDAAGEYSLTRNWVFAIDAIYQHRGNTRVVGTQDGTPLRVDTGSSWAFGVAPAIEYNFSPEVGVIAGVLVTLPGHNSTRSVAPILAINYVH